MGIDEEPGTQAREYNLSSLVLAELLLTVLPLVVLAIVYIYNSKGFYCIIASPEWSFGAAVLFGQTLIKMVAGVVKGKARGWEEIALIVALVIVGGLVPSLTILALVIISETHGVSLVLSISQIVFFLLSSLCFWFLGSVAHRGLFRG